MTDIKLIFSVLSPFFWLFLITTIIMIIAATKVQNTKNKIIIANLIAIPLALLIGETYCCLLKIEHPTEIVEYNRVLATPSNNLGWEPVKNNKVHSWAKFEGKKVFDVYYTIGKDGLRKTPSSNEKSNQCVSFFGCSFTFGQGLNDNETLPYFLGKETKNKYKIYNFGFSNYAPNQMLFQIEHGYLDDNIKICRQNTAIFSLIRNHKKRIVGKKSSGENDPKYMLINGNPTYCGNFNTKTLPLPKTIKFMKRDFELYTYLREYVLKKININNKDDPEKLQIEILNKSRKLLKDKYNTDRFIVIVWDGFRGNKKIINALNAKPFKSVEMLKKNHFEYYLISDILPDYGYYSQKYHIKNDGHPNKSANEIIAKFLAKKIKSNQN